MSTKNLLQRQLEIIQRSQRITSDYETRRSNAEARLKHDKETIESSWKRSKEATEATWQSDKATTIQQWNRTKAPVDRAIQSVHETIKSTQDILNRTRWQNTLPQNIQPQKSENTQAISTYSSFVEQILEHQTSVEQASMQIKTLLRNYKPRWLTFLAGVCGLTIAIILYFLLVSKLAGFFDDTTRYTILILTCLLTFVSTSILIYTQLYTLLTRIIRSKLQLSYVNLLQAETFTEDLYNKQLPGIDEPFKNQLDEGQTRYSVSIAQIDKTFQRQLNESQTRYNQIRQQLEQSLQHQLKGLKSDIETFIQETGLSGAAWTEPLWKQWQPLTPSNSFTRLGMVTLKSPTGNLPAMPLFVACPGRDNILVKATGTARNAAIEAIQAFMLRLLATQPPGILHFTLIDPIALGQNVAGFMQLADYDETLVTGRVWIQPVHIEQQLVDLTEHMGNIIRKYLCRQFQTLEEYKRAGGVNEPYRILVVMDFPANFTTDSTRQLVNIATNGPRCGVSTIVMVDTKQPMPPGFKLADLEQVSTIIVWDGQHFIWDKKE